MQYRVGTIAIANGSTTVTGIGTKFLGNVYADCMFIIDGDDSFYVISSVDTDTQLTLTSAYTESTKSAVPYVIVRDYTTNFELPLVRKGDTSWPILINEALERIDTILYEPELTDLVKWIQLEAITTTLIGSAYEGKIYYNGVSNDLRLAVALNTWKKFSLLECVI